MQRTILRIRKVSDATGAATPTIYQWVREGKFPKPVALSTDKHGRARSSGWYSDEIQAWIDSRPRA